MKAHQRLIREQRASLDIHPPVTDMASATVREINRTQAQSVILKYEWLGNMGVTERYFGLFFGEDLAGVACFGHPGSPAILNICGTENNSKVFLLSRGACVHWAHPHSASHLINEACRLMSVYGKFIFIAFADSDAGEIGTVYQAANWICVGRTTSEPMGIRPGETMRQARSLRVLTSGIRSREGRHKDKNGRLCFTVGGQDYYRGDTLPDGRLVAGSAIYPFILRGGKTVAEAKKKILIDLKQKGWRIVKGNPKIMYVGIFGTGGMRRALRKRLTRDVLPYPKRDAGQLLGTPLVPPTER